MSLDDGERTGKRELFQVAENPTDIASVGSSFMVCNKRVHWWTLCQRRCLTPGGGCHRWGRNDDTAERDIHAGPVGFLLFREGTAWFSAGFFCSLSGTNG